MMKQMSIFDYLPECESLKLGYLKDEDVIKHKGNEIPFAELQNYINKKVLLEMPRQSAVDYKVILITSYHKDFANYYQGKSIGMYDRVGYSDDNRHNKENSWVAEFYCKNGRYPDTSIYQESMYELL